MMRAALDLTPRNSVAVALDRFASLLGNRRGTDAGTEQRVAAGRYAFLAGQLTELRERTVFDLAGDNISFDLDQREAEFTKVVRELAELYWKYTPSPHTGPLPEAELAVRFQQRNLRNAYHQARRGHGVDRYALHAFTYPKALEFG